MHHNSISYKDLRVQKGLNLQQVGQLLNMDPSLLNRIENNIRRPTREQLMKLADLYQLDRDTLLIDWLSDKVMRELEGETLARQVLNAVEKKFEIQVKNLL